MLSLPLLHTSPFPNMMEEPRHTDVMLLSKGVKLFPSADSPSRLAQRRDGIAIDEILEHGKATIADMERLCPTISRRTLQRDLKQLVDKGLCVETALTSTDPTKCYVLKDV